MFYWDGDELCVRGPRGVVRLPKEATDTLVDMLRRMGSISVNCRLMVDWVLENGEVDPTSRSMLVDVHDTLKTVEEILP